MTAATIAANLASYALQGGLLLAAGLLLPALLRLRDPKARLRYWQVLLSVILLLPVLQPWKDFQVRSAVPLIGSTISDAVAATAVPSSVALSWTQILLFCLGIVAAARVAWLLAGLARLRSIRRSAIPLRPLPKELEALQECLHTRAEFMLTPAVGAPLTFGWWKPVVLVPPVFERLPRKVQTGAACHELLHVRRGDWLAVLAEEAGRAVLWFHPAVWLLLRRVALCREQVVDGEAVRQTGDRKSYLEALRQMALTQSGARTDPALLFLGRNPLVERVSLLVKEVTMSKSRVLASAATAAVLLALTAFLGAVVFPMVSGSSSPGMFTGVMAQAQAPEKVYKAGENKEIVAPILVEQITPEYPEELKNAKVTGKVVVEIVIDKSGKVTDAKILKSDDSRFNKSTVDAVLNWKYKPATLKGKPISTQWTVNINFRLDEK
jgi:bla regulator protein blaR1